MRTLVSITTIAMLFISVTCCYAEDHYPTGLWAKQPVLADVNNDGFTDILQAFGYDYFVSVFLNKGDGTFSDQTNYATYKVSHYVSTGDVNNDGFIDMIVSYGNTPHVSVYMNKGDGTFTDQISYDAKGSLIPAIVKDIDNDGWADIVLCSFGVTDVVQILMNNGDGTFADVVQYKRTENYIQNSLEMVDVDNDGYLDFISTFSEWVKDYRKIEVYKNKGDGTFDTPLVYDPQAKSAYLTIADVDNDGYQDIIGAHFDENKLSVLLNKVDGSYSDPVFYVTGSNPFPPTVADMNKDGYKDIIVSNNGGENVSVFMNKGDGTFENRVNYQVDKQLAQVTVSDLNKDGWNDMVVSSEETDYVYLLLNNKDGTFTNAGKYGPGNYYIWPALVQDVDNDGRDDIIQCDSGSINEQGYISVFRNVGNGKFDNSGIHLIIDSVWSSDTGLKNTLKMNFASYSDRSVDVDLYLVMVDPNGKIYSGMDWNEGLKPVARGLTLPPNMKIEDLPILNYKIPNMTPPIQALGTYTFAMALFKTGTMDMIMYLSRVDFKVYE
jgi:hypothetical protein